MKRFIAFVSILLGIYMVLMLSVRVVWVVTTQNQYLKAKCDPNINTIILGPSNGQFSWNDSIIKGSKNMCFQGVSYQSSYYTLRIAKERIKYDIDTVVLCAGLPTMCYYTDSILNKFDRYIWLEQYNSAYYYADFVKFNLDNPIFYKALFTHFSTGYLYNLYYGFTENDRQIGHNEYKDDAPISSVMEHIGNNKNGFDVDYIYDKCQIQTHYLKLICQYCSVNNIKLILLLTPTYKIQQLINDEGYKEFLYHNAIGDIEIADYTDMEIPYECFGDYEHLNANGANLFSENIKMNGLKTVTLREYCQSPWKYGK